MSVGFRSRVHRFESCQGRLSAGCEPDRGEPLIFRARRNERGANLKDAIAIVRTEWPEGFDPEAAGVIFED